MKNLQIESEDLDHGVVLVKPTGTLDVFSFKEMKAWMERLRDEKKDARILVDMSFLEYVASSGWAVLLGCRKIIRLSGGDLVLCGLREETRRVYDSMMISELLPSAGDADGALKLFSGA